MQMDTDNFKHVKKLQTLHPRGISAVDAGSLPMHQQGCHSGALNTERATYIGPIVIPYGRDIISATFKTSDGINISDIDINQYL